jgi:hypothetical protein
MATKDPGPPPVPPNLLEALEEAAEGRGDLADHFDAVTRQLAGRKWSELEAAEHAGYLLFPEVILRRTKSGKFEERPVMIRIPRPPEMRAARARARRQFREDGLDPKDDRDLFSQFENVVILSEAIRSATPPHEPFEPDPLVLEKTYDLMSLRQVWEKLDAYVALIDPQPELLTREQFVAVVSAMAEGRSIVPLDVISSSARANCVITMAVLLQSFLGLSSSSRSSETSTPEGSATESSSSSAATEGETE